MTSSTFQAVNIPVADIRVSAEHRTVSPDAAKALSESISLIGLRVPIEVLQSDDGYRLIFGATRCEAFRLLGRAEIPAFIKQADVFADEAAIRLVSIAENMVRRELSALDRSVDIADWCSIYRAAQPAVKPGRKAKSELSANLAPNSTDGDLIELSGRFAETFSEAAQSFLGVSRRGVFRALKIASIASDVRERISLHLIADNQSELIALAAESFQRQVAIVSLILGSKAGSVAEAIAVLDARPKLAASPWEQIAGKFGRLKPQDQDLFFNMHESAILRWMAERSA